jgi:hypothetical protein
VPSPSRLAPALAAALALTCLAAAAPAAAGTYTVRQCDYAAGNGHHDFQWQSAGVPTVDPHAGSGCGEFGLAVRNGGGGTQRTYPSGAYGGWFAYAPDGTVITAFSGAFGVLEGSCCVSGMASYAEATQAHDGQGARAYLFQGHLGNASWYAPSGLQGPVGRGWSSPASGFDAKRVGFHLRCGPGFSCSQSVHGDLRLRGRSFDFTLRDDVAPAVGDPTGTLLTGGWVRGVRTLSFPAHDTGGGLTDVEAVFDSGNAFRSPSSCTVVAGRYARLQPCPRGRAGDWAVDTARLPDGGRHLHLSAVDAGGARTQRTVAAYVDNGAPARPGQLEVLGGDGWRAANGFELTWDNPGGQYAPIARARWRACRAGQAGGCVNGARSGTGVQASGPIELPEAGEWDLEVWLEDSVGNADPDRASAPRRLRYDPDPPLLDLLPADPAAPHRVAATASDLSGVVGATVELRRPGSDAWTTLASTRSAGRIEAEVDEQLRAAGGLVAVRVTAVDAAGNAAVANATRELPTPAPVWIFPPIPDAGGLGVVVPAPQRAASRSRPHRAGRVTMTARSRVVRRGRAWRVTGRRGAKRRVAGRRGAGRRSADRRGRRPRLRDVRRLVTVGGRPVLFRGRVGRPVPRGGKLVEVQAHFRGRWRTISTVRAKRSGRWRFRYTFRTSRWRAAHRLRARVPVEAGYPFRAGASRPVRVTVLPIRR